MKDFFQTLLKPDREDPEAKERAEVARAADILMIGEFQFLQLAYYEWHGDDLPVELVDKLSKGSKKIAGGAAAVVTLGMDIGEIGQAKDIVKKIQKELPKLAQDYAALSKEAKQWSKQIDSSNKALTAAAKVYRSAAKKAAKSKKSRQELLKEFKQCSGP